MAKKGFTLVSGEGGSSVIPVVSKEVVADGGVIVGSSTKSTSSGSSTKSTTSSTTTPTSSSSSTTTTTTTTTTGGQTSVSSATKIIVKDGFQLAEEGVSTAQITIQDIREYIIEKAADNPIANQTPTPIANQTPIPTPTPLVDPNIDIETKTENIALKSIISYRKELARSTQLNYSFDYMSYLIFEKKTAEHLTDFYSALAKRVDSNSITDSYFTNQDNLNIVVKSIYGASMLTSGRIRNIISFYLYFNEKLNFVSYVLMGNSLDAFVNDINLDTIMETLSKLGLYPLTSSGLFERVYESVIYTAGNAENELITTESIKSYLTRTKIDYETTSLYEQINKMILEPKIQPYYIGDKYFTFTSGAFYTFKELYEDWQVAREIEVIDWLKEFLPDRDVYNLNGVFGIAGGQTVVPDKLWYLMARFNDEYKLEKKDVINKDYLKTLFEMFLNESGYQTWSVASLDEGADGLLSVIYEWFIYLVGEGEENYGLLGRIDSSNYASMIVNFKMLVAIYHLVSYIKVTIVDFDSLMLDVKFEMIDEKISEIFGLINNVKGQLIDLFNYVVYRDKRFRRAFIPE